MGTQYTLRAVPHVIDRALRRRAKQEAKSLNTVAGGGARARTGTRGPARDAHHLDALIGSWQEDPAVGRALADFERVAPDAGK